MRKLTKIEIAMAANKLSDGLMCAHGLKNAKKITHSTWKNLQIEEKRRRGLK